MGAHGSKNHCHDHAAAEATDGPVTFGENVVESAAAKKGPTSYTIPKMPLPVVCVFDNKSHPDQPRLGVVQNGVAVPIKEGDSSALSEADLESISVVDAEKGMYVAGSSLGVTHVFILQQKEAGGSTFVAKQVSTGQLPVPKGESTGSWQDANRTNIEAMRCGTGLDGTLMIGWGGRGGEDYAGKETSDRVWLRWAPFDPATGMADESKMKSTTLKNVGPTEKWRTLSAMDVNNGYFYFTAAYDGEEDGHPMNLEDPARASSENKLAMSSLVARASIKTGETEVIMRLEGLKLEAIIVISENDEEVQCMLGSDDEGLGSLIGTATFAKSKCGHLEPSGPLNLLDIAKASSVYDVAQKRWGTSGMAPFHSVLP